MMTRLLAIPSLFLLVGRSLFTLADYTDSSGDLHIIHEVTYTAYQNNFGINLKWITIILNRKERLFEGTTDALLYILIDRKNVSGLLIIIFSLK